ncbi:Golgi apparatus membrane protein tvp18 [Dinochytrium kinnereticum]|nr:Golgi apparatus membrane protein tvp18 [Dinochytrium kinnereticum]
MGNNIGEEFRSGKVRGSLDQATMAHAYISAVDIVYNLWAMDGHFIRSSLANFTAVLPFAFAAWVEAAIIVLLEIPIITQCCPCGPNTSSFLKFFENTVFRTILYLVFAGIIWLSIIMAASSIIVAALALTVTFVFYGIASSKKEELQRSFYTGGKGINAAPAAAGGKATGGRKLFAGLGMAKSARAAAGTV